MADNIHDACKKNDSELAKRILRGYPGQVGAKDDLGYFPLHWAAALGHSGVVKILLENAADPNVRNDDGLTPLLLTRDKESVNLLLEYGADLNFMDTSGRTVLHETAGGNYLELVEILLANGAEVDVKDIAGSTPLHIAAASNRYHTAERLITAKAEVNARDDSGDTPLHKAARERCPECIRILLENSANVNAMDSRGRTALHFTVGPQECQILLKYGADCGIRDHDGNLPFDGTEEYNLYYNYPRTFDILAPLTVPYLLDELKNKDKEIRRRAIQTLGECSGFAKPAIPALIDLLEEVEGHDRLNTCRAIWGISNKLKEIMPILIKEISQGKKAYKEHAASIIGCIGKDASEAIPVIISEIDSSCDEDVRSDLIETLGEIGISNKSVLDFLTNMVKDDNYYYHWSDALNSISKIGDEKDLPTLFEVLRKSKTVELDSKFRLSENDYYSSQLTINTAEAILDFSRKIEHDLPKIIEIIYQKNEFIDHSLVWHLTLHLHDKAFSVAIELIKHDNEVVRGFGVKMLGELGIRAAPAVSTLKDLLNKEKMSSVKEVILEILPLIDRR